MILLKIKERKQVVGSARNKDFIRPIHRFLMTNKFNLSVNEGDV